MSIHENEEQILTTEILRKILDNCYDEIQALDGNGRVIYTNKGTERHSGKKISEVIGKNVPELIQDNYWNPIATPIVLKEKRQITLKQKSAIGKTVITTSTPIFNERGELELIIHNTRDLTQIELMLKELHRTKQELNNVGELEFVAYSEEIKEIIKYARLVAGVDSTVLILGESGTGKGVIARHIHNHSLRKNGPFLAINCAAIPEDLLESELFGYSCGAFTGADKGGKKGLIEMANSGTLFLDEIAELSPRLQAKILQMVQDRQFIPIGSNQVKKANVRIITATNCDLLKMSNDGKFRKDLYYRLNVIEITLPPLKERRDDIIPLVHFFLGKFSKKYNICYDVSDEVLDALYQYSWPGNVRELENLIERLVVTVQEPTIEIRHLPKKLVQSAKEERKKFFPITSPLDEVKTEVEKDLVIRAYKELGSSCKVAEALKISQPRAWRLIKKYCDAAEES